MKQRTKDINKAIREAKKRDGCCLVTGVKHGLDGAHLLPRNVGFKRYDPRNPLNILTLHRIQHQSFDMNHSPESKIAWLDNKGLHDWANRIRWIIGDE